MKNIKTNIFLFAMFAVSPLMVNAQSTDDVDDEVDTLVAKKESPCCIPRQGSRPSSRRRFIR